MIYIPFDKYSGSIGGPSTFMLNFREYLTETGYPFIDNESDYRSAGGIFFPISFNSRVLGFFKKNNLPIIQRLDGVYYPSKHGIKYLYLNRQLKKDYLKFSDFIIFQSEYSKKECFAILGKIDKEKYRVIYNGTNKSIFYSGNKNFSKNKIIFTAVGSFRSIDMIEPIILALDLLKDKYNIEFKVIGPVLNKRIISFIKRPYINYMEQMDREGISNELRNTDILIYSQLNPPCPNAVIEAISCGIPVVGFDTGSMRELLYFCPELLAYVSEDVFQKYEDFKYRRLLEKINLCIENYGSFKKRFISNSHLYDNKETFSEYLKVFDKLRAGK